LRKMTSSFWHSMSLQHSVFRLSFLYCRLIIATITCIIHTFQIRHYYSSSLDLKIAYCMLALQHTATHCNTLQHTATYCNTPPTHCNTLHQTATYCNTPPTHCDTLQHTATHRNTLQHTATHYSILQHSATHCNTPRNVSEFQIAYCMLTVRMV